MPDNTNNNTQKVDTLFFDQVDINVENLYNSIIKKIDGIRSYVALSSVKIDKNIN